MQPGDLLDLDVSGVAHGGVFVARHEGRVVFVPDTLPGERVRVRLTDTRKSSFWRGEVLEVLDAAPERRPHVWAQADVDVAPEDRPGGADFGHITPAHQRELKHRVLVDALERIGRLDAASLAAEPVRTVGAILGEAAIDEAPTDEAATDEDGIRWRTRVSLHVDDAGRVGPYAARSHRVIEVSELPLATASIERAALALRGGDAGRIDLVQPADGRVRILHRPEPASPRGRGRGRRPAGAASDGPRRGAPENETIRERVGDREFRVDAGGFWQVHRHAAATLTRAVTDALTTADGAPGVDPDAWHLDLYGGVGLFAAALADIGGPATRVTSVESDARATEHAGENLVEWIGARAETDRVDRWIRRLRAEASPAERERLQRGVVLLDPPRAGAGTGVVADIAALEPRTVVYVACDPVALARDLGAFRDAGYEATSLTPIDLFPNSHHLEAVATLSRSDPRG